MKKSLWMIAFVPFWLVGCSPPPGVPPPPSLHPISTEEDLIFVPELLGTWYLQDAPEAYIVSSDDHGSYELVIRGSDGEEEKETSPLSVHLIRIKGTMFLDIFPPREAWQEAYPLFLPSHLFFLVEQIEPNLKVSSMDPDWLESYLEEHPRSLRHEIIEGVIVLTAPTKKLRAFLLKHMKKGAFAEPFEMTRQ